MTCRLTPVLLMVALLANQPRPPVAPPASAQQATIEHRAPQPTPRLPLAFQAHTGSPDPEVRFAARGGGLAVFVMSQGFALALSGEEKLEHVRFARAVQLPDARRRLRIGF